MSTAYHLATRHGITNVAVLEAQLHRVGQLGSQHDHHPGELRHPGIGALLPALVWTSTTTIEDETGCWVMHATKGLIWLAHTESGMRARACPRPAQHRPAATNTVMVTPGRGQGAVPAAGPLRRRAISRAAAAPTIPVGRRRVTTRVVWAYAQGAMRRGVHVHQHTPVTGLRASDGEPGSPACMHAQRPHQRPAWCMSGGRRPGHHHGTDMGRCARCPVRTHPLQAFVTNGFAQGFGPILSRPPSCSATCRRRHAASC